MEEILLANWDEQLKNNPAIHIFGEDVGYIGGLTRPMPGFSKNTVSTGLLIPESGK